MWICSTLNAVLKGLNEWNKTQRISIIKSDFSCWQENQALLSKLGQVSLLFHYVEKNIFTCWMIIHLLICGCTINLHVNCFCYCVQLLQVLFTLHGVLKKSFWNNIYRCIIYCRLLMLSSNGYLKRPLLLFKVHVHFINWISLREFFKTFQNINFSLWGIQVSLNFQFFFHDFYFSFI